MQPIYHPNVHNHGTPIYFKQNDVPTEKSAVTVIETDNKITETKAIETKTDQPTKVEKMEQPKKQPEKVVKIEPTKLPTPMNEILGVNATAKI